MNYTNAKKNAKYEILAQITSKSIKAVKMYFSRYKLDVNNALHVLKYVNDNRK